MIKNYALVSLETLINQVVQLDPQSPPRLKALAGKVVLFTILPFELNIYFVVASNQISLIDEYTATPTASISATPFSFAKMLIGNREMLSQLINQNEVKLEGDIATAQQLQQIFRELHIDWEQQLAKLTGDVAAYHINNLWRQGSDVTKQILEKIQHSITDCIQEEARLSPSQEEVDRFKEEIDQLRLNLDRLSAKIINLQPQHSHD